MSSRLIVGALVGAAACLVVTGCGATASPTPAVSGAAAAACSVLTADDMFYYLGSHFAATPGSGGATCAYRQADGSADAVLTLVGSLESTAAASDRLRELGAPAPDLAMAGIDEAVCSADGHTVAARSGSTVVSVSYSNTAGAPSQCAARSVSWSLSRVALGVLGGKVEHPSPFPTG